MRRRLWRIIGSYRRQATYFGGNYIVCGHRTMRRKVPEWIYANSTAFEVDARENEYAQHLIILCCPTGNFNFNSLDCYRPDSIVIILSNHKCVLNSNETVFHLFTVDGGASARTYVLSVAASMLPFDSDQMCHEHTCFPFDSINYQLTKLPVVRHGRDAKSLPTI